MLRALWVAVMLAFGTLFDIRAAGSLGGGPAGNPSCTLQSLHLEAIYVIRVLSNIAYHLRLVDLVYLLGL